VSVKNRPAIERGELAAGLRLSPRTPRRWTSRRIDGAEARDGRRPTPRSAAEHLARDVAKGARHLDAIGLRRQLVGARARDEAVLAEVGLRRPNAPAWIATYAQWWLVAISPSAEMKLAVHPPRLTTARSSPPS
jgi:hypothetical protein